MHHVFDWKRNELRHIYAAQSQPHGETPGCGDHNILSILTTIDLFRLIITSLLLIPRQIVMIDSTWRKSFNAPQLQTWELFVPVCQDRHVSSRPPVVAGHLKVT